MVEPLALDLLMVVQLEVITAVLLVVPAMEELLAALVTAEPLEVSWRCWIRGWLRRQRWWCC